MGIVGWIILGLLFVAFAFFGLNSYLDSDVAGYAAASYQRGVNFIQLPTTLLSQVDSSVGGKTAINHALGKNMIGAFWQPGAVLIDIDTLHSLPPRELAAGLASETRFKIDEFPAPGP